jgi:hypothetical protein
MPIDLTKVDWLYVILLALFVFVSTGIGNLVSFRGRGMAAFLSAVFFAIIFIFWTYYPHNVPFLPKTLTVEKAPVAAPPAAPAQPTAPVRPRNPVTDITPPKNPITDITPPANRQ